MKIFLVDVISELIEAADRCNTEQYLIPRHIGCYTQFIFVQISIAQNNRKNEIWFREEISFSPLCMVKSGINNIIPDPCPEETRFMTIVLFIH